jgi:cobalt-zinc-cadmium efflux system protein
MNRPHTESHDHDHHHGDHDHDHGHAHSHSHAHDHAHSHAPKDFGTAFAIATALNLGLVAIQAFYGVVAHSVALLADAGHNFGDALGLMIAWGAHGLAKLNPTARYTYGFRSASILAALLNSVILLVATGAIAWEAIGRFFEPGAVAGLTVMIVAAFGIAINGLAAWLLMAGQDDLNIRGAFLHLVGDAAVSFGVVVAGGAILLTGWSWLDPAVSLIISGIIVWGTWGLLREAINRSLGAVPSTIDPKAVALYLQDLQGVVAIHDLHVWAMSTTETALTCHLVMPQGHPGDEFLRCLDQELHSRFRIAHPTIQIELGDAGTCRLEPEHIV